MQLAHPKVAQPKLEAFRPPVCLSWTMPRPTRMPDGPAKNPAVGKAYSKLMQSEQGARAGIMPCSLYILSLHMTESESWIFRYRMNSLRISKMNVSGIVLFSDIFWIHHVYQFSPTRYHITAVKGDWMQWQPINFITFLELKISISKNYDSFLMLN